MIGATKLTDFFLKALINTAVDLCLLRLRPQDLPASPILFLLATLLNLLVGVLVVVGSQITLPVAFLESLFAVTLMQGTLYIALKLRHRLIRFNQTATALMLSGLLLDCLALPLLAWNHRDESGESVLLLMVLMFWGILVMGHILRHAFEMPLNMGISVALLYTLFSWFIAALFFPVAI